MRAAAMSCHLTPIGKLALWAAVAAMALALAPGQLKADNIPTLSLPQPPPPPGRIPPWQIQVDASGVEGQAFRGVKITVATGNGSPTTRDHSLRVVLCANGYNKHNYDEKVTAFIEVPNGTASIDAIVEVPQRQAWNALHVQFFEDGSPLRNYEAVHNLMRSGARNAGDDSVGILVIDADAPTRDEFRALMTTITSAQSPLKNQHKLPDVRWLLAAVPANMVAGNTILSYTEERFDDAQLLQTYAGHDGLDLLPPAELSARWLSQSNADLTVISLDDLKLLKAQHPQRHQALQQWTMAGGSLVVYGCGDEWEQLPDVCRLTGVPDDKTTPGESSRWQLANRSKFQNQVEGIFDQNQGNTSYVAPSAWTTPPFALARCGLGAVVAYKSEEPFPGKPSDWGGLLNSLESRQFLWSRRHGMSHQQENPDFWNFVIPGVGEAPVFSFMTMIALFMLLIGPANYYYLNRWRRLSLLLITVPLGAGIFTASLFAFALVSDGFSTRTRIRSYTVLEPSTGLAASISRQTYYTAFVPSDGMRYPTDTAVYPLHHSPYEDAVQNSHFYQSDSEWLDGKLQLQRRYLSAREHRQFMTVRSTPCQARLEVRSSGDKLQVKNLLGTDIDIALLIDDQGRLRSVEHLAADAVTEAPLIEPAAASAAWHKRLDPKLPAMPTQYDPNRYDTLFSRNRYNYRYWGRNQSQWAATQGTSALERGINDLDPILNRLRDGINNAAASHERTFTAITTDSVKAEDGEPLAPLGIKNSDVVEALHMVRGRW